MLSLRNYNSKNNNIIQPKLTIGQPDDQYEKEADAVADKIMQMPETPPPVQKKSEAGEEEEELQMKPLSSTITPLVQKQETEKEKGLIQLKKSSESTDTSTSLESKLQNSKGKGSPLPDDTLGFMNRSFGSDFSDVKVHTDSEAVQMNEELGAQAFTNGENIFFNKNEYQPNINSGKHLLAHELVHTKQQEKGIKLKIQTQKDKISNYSKFQGSKELESSNFYERLISKHFSIPTTVYSDLDEKVTYENKGANPEEKIQVLSQAWLLAPREAEDKDGFRKIKVKKPTNETVGLTLQNGEKVYYSFEYLPPGNTNEKPTLNIKFLYSNKDKEINASSIEAGSPDYKIKKYVLAGSDSRNYDPEYDYSFPPIPSDENGSNRQNYFFSKEENSISRARILKFLTNKFNSYYWKNRNIAGKIRRLNKKIENPKTNKKEKEELSKKQQNLSTLNETGRFYFKNTLNVSGEKFFIEALFERDKALPNEILITFIDIAYLGKINETGELEIEKKPTTNTLSEIVDYKIASHFNYLTYIKERPSFIGLEKIENNKERAMVKDLAFEHAFIKENIRDSHIDQVVVIDGVKYLYTFIIEKPEDENTIPGSVEGIDSKKKQVNIIINRIGRVGTDNSKNDLADPEELRIQNVYGYSEDFTEENLVSFITQRYSKTINASEITGKTKEEKISSINYIINTKSKNLSWFESNYNIKLFNNTPELVSKLTGDEDYFALGIKEPEKERAHVKGKTDELPGSETDEAVGVDGIIEIDNELEGLKDWSVTELKYFEMSFQKFSNKVLDIISGASYFRQSYCLLKDLYNLPAGITHPKSKMVAIYDLAFQFENVSFFGSKTGVSSMNVGTITHETGHLIDHTGTGEYERNGNTLHAIKINDLFNRFYKSIGIEGPTDYSRDVSNLKSHSPESEFFPEAFKLFIHDPEFMYKNFPRIYMWLYYLSEAGKAPEEALSQNFIDEWEEFKKVNNREPDITEIKKIAYR